MQLFENSIKLRGFLGSNAEVLPSDGIKNDSFAVLTLCIVSGTWKKSTNEWSPWTDWHRIICPGPYFCGFTRGMKRGAYIEVEGELHISRYDRPVVIAGQTITSIHPIYEVHATQIRKLEYPAVGVDLDDDD